MEAVLWDAERGAWFDYSLVTHSRHAGFHPSNLSPVWAQCYSRPEMGERALQYLKVGAGFTVMSDLKDMRRNVKHQRVQILQMTKDHF